MNVDREAVANALFNLVAGTQISNQAVFKTKSRKVRLWSNVVPADQPAMFLAHTGEQVLQNEVFGVAKYLLHFEIVIYARGDANPAVTPDTLVNSLLGALDTQMQSVPPGQRQTLGGLVYHAWIEGDVLIDGGVLDNQVAIMVPVRVRTTT